MAKTALITGITGQDGAYLAELLLGKGYVVHGLKRRSSSFNTGRIDHLYEDPHEPNRHLILHYGDLTDATNLIRVVQEVQPDEIYNLAAQSHVKVSFETPEYTANADGIGTLRLLEAIRILKMEERDPLLSGEHVGAVRRRPGTAGRDDAVPAASRLTRRPSSTPTGSPRTTARPTGCTPRTASSSTTRARSAARPSSPARSRRAVAAIELGLQERLYIGNLDSLRDWGHARDYVEGMWRIVQADAADDWVLATGEAHTVRDFITRAFAETGKTIAWQGEGEAETGIDQATGKTLVQVDPGYFRPLEVHHLEGDATKARQRLGWHPTTSFADLVKDMVQADLASLCRERASGRVMHEAAE